MDDRSLVSCREVSKTWQEYVDSQRIFWIRKILKYANPQTKFHEEWKMVLDKKPIKTLMKFARFVWSQPKYECSPLYVAGAMGDIELFNSVKEKTGLKEDSKNNRGDTPFHTAAYKNHINLCKVIIEKLQDKNPFHLAAKLGHLEVCKFLCLNLEDQNPKNEEGITPLHLAAEFGHLDVVKLLCSNLEEKNPKDYYDRTPLEEASSNRHWKIVLFLIAENNLN